MAWPSRSPETAPCFIPPSRHTMRRAVAFWPRYSPARRPSGGLGSPVPGGGQVRPSAGQVALTEATATGNQRLHKGDHLARPAQVSSPRGRTLLTFLAHTPEESKCKGCHEPSANAGPGTATGIPLSSPQRLGRSPRDHGKAKDHAPRRTAVAYPGCIQPIERLRCSFGSRGGHGP